MTGRENDPRQLLPNSVHHQAEPGPEPTQLQVAVTGNIEISAQTPYTSQQPSDRKPHVTNKHNIQNDIPVHLGELLLNPVTGRIEAVKARQLESGTGPQMN